MKNSIAFLLCLITFGLQAQDISEPDTTTNYYDQEIIIQEPGAEGEDDYENYEESNEYDVEVREIEPLTRPTRKVWTDEQWEKVSDEPDYVEEPEKEKKEDLELPEANIDEPETNWLMNFLSSGLVQVLLFSAIIILLLFFIIRFMSEGAAKRNRRLGNIDGYSIESLEENLEETDLDRYLRLAIEANDFKSAVRIFYLAIIKVLHERQWIKWRREKTNFDYVFEMRPTQHFHRFRDMTRAFEIVWYGDLEVTEREYRALEKEFRKFLEEIDRAKEK